MVDGEGISLGAQSMLQVGLQSDERPALFHWSYWNWGNSADGILEQRLLSLTQRRHTFRYFSINEQTYPTTLEDPNALVSVALGDTCWIAIANHGFKWTTYCRPMNMCGGAIKQPAARPKLTGQRTPLL